MLFPLWRDDFNLSETGLDNGCHHIAGMDDFAQLGELAGDFQHAFYAHSAGEGYFIVNHLLLKLIVLHIEVNHCPALVIDSLPAIACIGQHRGNDFYDGILVLQRRKFVRSEDELVELFPFDFQLPGSASVAVVEGEEENTVAETAEAGASAPVVQAPPAASGNIWKAAGQFFKTVKEAIDAIFNADPAATEAKVELTEDYEGSDGIEVDVDEGKNVVIDLCKKTFKVISGIAAKLTGKGSVTVENGTVASEADAAVVETDVADLDIKNVNLIGSGSASPVLDINGGDVDVTGRTTIDSGKSGNTAIDISGASDVDVDTTGVVLGKVSASGAGVAADLHNGFYNGEISADADAKLAVDGGNYTTNVGKYVDEKTNYAEISNPAGKIYSAGKNIPWSALGSSMFAPTFVNMLKSGGAIALPGNIAVGNSTGKLIFINGRAVLNGQSIFIPGCRYMCSPVSIVDGANSVWYKGSEDGLTFELSAAVSYVAIDNAKADAVIDGVYAELEADTLEALSAGSHSVRFVLKNGSVVVTSIKVAPDEKIEWTKGSENGLQYEMSGKIKKVLIDHVKVSAETDGKNAVIPASILQDLKTGKHTVEFVLENTAHVVTSITVK